MVKRESRLKVKTSRDVVSSLRAAERNLPRSLHDLEGLEAAVQPDVPAGCLERLLQQEQDRFARQEASVHRAQEKLLQARQKLKDRKHLNQQVAAYRRQLMAGRTGGSPPQAPSANCQPEGAGQTDGGFVSVPLKY